MIKQTLCFSNRAKLSCRLGQLVIELPQTETSDAVTTTRPIEDIGVILLESHSITITSACVNALLENNVAIITCDGQHMPNGLMMPLNCNTLQSERFRNQIAASLPLKKQLWQQTVSSKIHNQWMTLRKWGEVECGCMKVWSNNVMSNDSSNLEGRAAAFYWKNLFVDNPKFKRERGQEGVNSLLNYGYAILRSVIARALVGSGLLPTLGIHHSNRYNAYCLADDIMEPYRPFVDDIVLTILQRSTEYGFYDGETPLTKDVKIELLKIPTIDVTIGKLMRPLMIAATMTTASLSKCFDGESRKILYPIFTECEI